MYCPLYNFTKRDVYKWRVCCEQEICLDDKSENKGKYNGQWYCRHIMKFPFKANVNSKLTFCCLLHGYNLMQSVIHWYLYCMFRKWFTVRWEIKEHFAICDFI